MAFENVDRLRVSALSRENKDFAYAEEILVHKSTGEFLLRTKDGKGIISVDSIMRQKQAFNELKQVANVLGTHGIVYATDINNIVLPETLTDVNIITSDIEIFPPGLVTDFIINIDIDSLVFDSPTDIAKLDFSPIIELIFYIQSETGEKSDIKITKSVDDINKEIVLKSDYIGGQEYENSPLYLKSLRLVNNPDNMDVNKLHILHNILFLF